MIESTLGIDDKIEEIVTSVKNFLMQTIQEIWDTMERPNLRLLGIAERGE